jgi:dihydroorotase
MDILLKQVKLIDKRSTFHKKKVDILIEKGIISKINKSIKAPAKTKIWAEKNTHVSIGWFDIGTQLGEPGFEQRETIESATRAAIKGGYTGIACFPNTNPVLDQQSSVSFIINKANTQPIDIYPIGAVSKSCDGKEIAEMVDMHHAGAIAFSDGDHPLHHSGILLRALEYSKSFNGLIINKPANKEIQSNGLIHEGEISIQLGMSGIPSIAESLTVHRDCELCAYANGRLLIHSISAKESLKEIKSYKKKGLHIDASISYLNLVYTDKELTGFDANLKVLPPLRSESDRKALLKALSNGEVNVITSNHQPIEPELKEKEFFYSPFGAIGLQTSFSAVNTYCKNDIELETIINALSAGPRSVLGLDIPQISVGSVANLTLFDPKEKWVFSKDKNQSNSVNSPFINHEFVGKVQGIIHQNSLLQ